MLPRPPFRMPLWAALAAAAGAFVARSVIRGFDWSPDLPSDAFVLLMLIVVVGLVGWMRADDARRDREPEESLSDNRTDPDS